MSLAYVEVLHEGGRVSQALTAAGKFQTGAEENDRKRAARAKVITEGEIG
jgi:hypothetical protein